MRNLIIFSVFLVYIFSFNSWARKPAVDPQMGIATVEFEPVAPEIAKGFNFTNTTRVPASQKAPLSGGAPFLLIALFLGLPIGIWFVIMAKASTNKKSNVVAFPTQKREEEESDDYDFPQAS